MKIFLFVLLMVGQVFAAEITSTSSQSKLAVIITPTTTVWATLASGDNGVGVEAGYAKSINIQLRGTFTATTVVVEGSNDGITYFQLDDIEGTAISKTAESLIEIRDRPRYIRPRISAGGAATAVIGLMYLTK